MNQEGGGKNGSEKPKPDPLSVTGNSASDSEAIRVEAPAHPPVIAPDKNVSPKVPDNKSNKQIKKGNPLLVRVIEDDELNAFEQKTLKYAKAGFAVGLITIFLAGLTALIFYGQFKEAAGQTDMLSISARQSRRDSEIGDLRAQQQIAELQRQAKAAQELAKQAKRSADTTPRAFLASNRPYVGVSNVTADRKTFSDRVIVTASMHNYGTGVATKVTMPLEVVINGIRQPRMRKYSGIPPSVSGILFPNNGASIHMPLYKSERWTESFLWDTKSTNLEIITPIIYYGPNGRTQYEYCDIYHWMVDEQAFALISMCNAKQEIAAQTH